MPIFKPFKGVRPNESYLSHFPTHPLDHLTDEEMQVQSGNVSSYLNMLKPYLDSSAADFGKNLKKVRENYQHLRDSNVLMQDQSSYYLYEQIYPDKQIFRGLLGLVSAEDFENGKIKRHESTIPHKKEKLAEYLDIVKIQAEPVLLTYPANSKIELLMTHEEKNLPLVKHTDDRGIVHKIWRIDNRLKMQQMKEVLDQVDAFYIADGHHRVGSTALNARNHREKNKKHTGTEPYNFIYAFIVSNQSIKIHDYNRYITDLNGMTEEEFFKKLEASFTIHEKGDQPYFPSKKYHFSMYLGGKFYSLHVKHELRSNETDFDHLDHILFDHLVLRDILHIEKSDSSDKVKFLKGNSTTEGIIELKKRIDRGEGKVAFGIHPISFSEIVKISDNRISMPPKCTYIEPKLMTALLMYDMA